MKQKKEVGEGDSVMSTGMETPSGKDTVTITDTETPAVGKGKKLGIKRVKKKPDMNISKGKLKSVNTPKNFSFLNMSVQKQTLRANNRALAQNLAKARQDIRQLNTEIQMLRSQNQEQCLELNRLKLLVGMKDEEIQQEVQQRIQDEMQAMHHTLEELTQSMMQSSRYINKMNNKCLVYCSRRSTDSTRSVSLGSGQGNQSLTRLNSRATFKELGSKEDLMAKYLSKADEFTAPPGSRMFNDNSNAADMSIIAEQSILDSSEDTYSAHPLTSVEEAVTEVSPDDTVVPTKPLSKLPQRVLKYTDTAKSKTNSSESISSETSSKKGSDLSETEKSGKEFVKSRSKSSKTNDLPSGKHKDSEKVNNESNSKPKPNVKNKVDQTGRENRYETKENDLDADISAFGFGGSFAADLVSGSPISAEKRRVTFVMSKQTEVAESKSKETEKKRETFVKPKEIEICENKSSGKEESRKQRETFAVPKAPSQVNTKGKKESRKLNDVKVNVNHTKNSKKKENSEKLSSKTKEKRRETYATENPFVAKIAKIQRSPVKGTNEEDVVYDGVTDPFKPTKTLMRSPVRISDQSSSPEKKVDSLAFLAKFRESLESKQVESLPLPDPEIPDEPTMYFNSEMEFTSVIDSTRLLQALSRSQKDSPVVPLEDESELHMINSNKHKKLEEAPKPKDMDKIGSVEKSDKQQETSEAAAVEVRTKKPGVFTFSVSRKEADGTRKAVPEKVSKARSKKKRPVTPEKDEGRIGHGRDMFNFGDRTPTVPLEKLAKAKNVYDLSMNESVAAPLVSLKNFVDKEQPKLTESQSGDQIYYVPLKTSSEEEPVSKHARSKSRSRSKSRKNYEDDDEEWVPGGESRARSKSRGRKTNEETTRRRGRSQSCRRGTDENELDIENDSDEKLTARSKSKNSEMETGEISKRRCRSRSQARIIMDNEDTENTKEDENGGYVSEEIKSVGGKRSYSEMSGNRPGRSKTRKDRDNLDDEIDSNDGACRRGRSRSRARSKVDETKISNDDSEYIAETRNTGNTSSAPRRSARSKSQARKPIVDDDSEDFENSPQIQRKSRSRSIHGRKPYEIKAEDENESHRRKTYEIKAEDENESENDKGDAKKELKSKAKKQYDKDLELQSQDSKIVPVIVVPASDDSESTETEDVEYCEKVPNYKVKGSEQDTVEESESDSENIKRLERSRRKSNRRVKSARYDESEFEENFESSKSENKSKHSVSSKTKIDSRETSNISMADMEINNFDRNFAFINKRRGKSMRIPDDSDLDEEYVNEHLKESSNVDSKEKLLISNDKAGDRYSQSPIVSKKTEDRKASKSVKKSTKKRKPEDSESKSGKSRQNITEKLEKDECNDRSAKSSVTPVLVPDVSKKSAKTSRTGKSVKKTKADHLPDQTPLTKEKSTTNQVADKPNALALLKKRLTMVGTKHFVHEDRTADEKMSRKRSNEEIDQHQIDECESSENKRAKRNRNPVSYVTKPLNCKLRQGDQMFQDTAMSKVKAEQTRLAIAKKTSVPKISRDDKENILEN